MGLADSTMAEMKLLVGVSGIVIACVTAAVFSMVMGQVFLPFLCFGMVGKKSIYSKTIISVISKHQLIQLIVGNIKLPLRVKSFGGSKKYGFPL